jgi:hypothetical protein
MSRDVGEGCELRFSRSQGVGSGGSARGVGRGGMDEGRCLGMMELL